MENGKHVIVIGEQDQEILRKIALDLDAVTWDPKLVPQPLLEMCLVNMRPSTAHHGDQGEVQVLFHMLYFLRAMNDAELD
jgi:hypothetical protein